MSRRRHRGRRARDIVTKQFAAPMKPIQAAGANIRKHRPRIDRFNNAPNRCEAQKTGDDKCSIWTR